MRVDFYKHNLDEQDMRAVVEAMKSPFLTTGELVHEFEKRLAEYTCNEYAIGLMSCTHALMLALKLYNIGSDDEVITTPMTFAATANSILHVEATPVFVDVEPDTGNIDASLVEGAITPRTRAILVVHLYGLMCDMVRLREIADRHDLILIEDSAHCIEGARDGVRPGNLGDAACFSFYATKNITSGEGGAIVVHDEAQAALLAQMSLHGMSKSAEKRFGGDYVHWDMDVLGYKANMSNIQAAMLLHQLERIDLQWERREQICRTYEHAFHRTGGVDFPIVPEGAKSARHLFTIWVDPSQRDEIIARMNQHGVGVTVNYRAVHLLKYYRERFGFERGMFPNAERIGDSTITLPMYPKLMDEEVRYVIAAVQKAVSR